MSRKWTYCLIVEMLAAAIILILFLADILSPLRLLVGIGFLASIGILMAIPSQDFSWTLAVNALTLLGRSVAGFCSCFLLFSFYYDNLNHLSVTPFILFAVTYWLYELWDHVGKRNAIRKLQSAEINTVIVDSLSQLKMLYDNSAMTWEEIPEKDYGLVMSTFCDDGIDGEAFITTGKVMNDLCHLTGTNAYPDELRILSILNYSKKFEASGRESIHRYGARWMDDIIDNNSEREGYSPF